MKIKFGKMKTSTRMTEGNPYRHIITFSIPILLGNLFQQFYNLADLMIVSDELGLDALGSVGATYAITGLLYAFINGLTGGFSIITAQFYGAEEPGEVKRSVAATVTISLSLTVVFTVLSLLLIRQLFEFLHTPASLIPGAYDYISILLAGLLFTMLYNMFANILKAIGNSVMPLVFLVLAAILNIGLDLLFVKQLHWGIRGASGATVLAQAISAILCLIYILRKCPEIHISRKDFRFDRQLLSKMITTGLSMSMMLSIVSIGSVILQSGINGLGETVLAAHTAARKILEVCMMPFTVFGAAVATFAGQNYGAKRMDRVWQGTKASLILSFVWSGMVCLILLPFAPHLIEFIANDNSPEILRLGSMYLYWGAPPFFALSILLMLRNVLQGIGHRIAPITASALELITKVIAIKVLVPRYEYLGVCLTEPIIWVLCGFLILIYYLVVRKKSTKPVHR